MTNLVSDYFSQVHKKLNALSGNDDTLRSCGKLMGEAVLNGKNIFIFGASHAGIVAEEATYRAGGLAIFNPIFHSSLMLNVRPITLTTDIENIEGIGKKIIEASPIQAGDILLIHSVSGRNPIVIDVAFAAREKGATLIAITSLDTAKRVSAKHSSNKLLSDVANYVIDNMCDFGDASVAIPGMVQKAAPLSTIMSVTIMNCLSLVVCETMMSKGKIPPVLASANIDGNDTINREIFASYRQQIHYL